MPPDRELRRVSKDATRNANTRYYLRPSVIGSRTTSQPSPATPPSRITFPQEQDPGPSARSQQAAASSQLVSSTSQLTPTPSLPAATSVQLAGTGSKILQTAKKVGVDAWSGLKVGLKLLEISSDVFPPLKSAVAGFLGVVYIFQVYSPHLHVPACALILLCRRPPRTETTTQSSLRTFSAGSSSL